MSQPADVSIATHFADLEAPRLLGKTRHRLLDMVVIAISAIICHADDGVSVAEFGRSKEDWFRGFLDLPNGIPSHDTFNRLFARLSPEAFQACFTRWAWYITPILFLNKLSFAAAL